MDRAEQRDVDDSRQRLIAGLASAASGEAAGLRQVYDLSSAKLFGICLRISGDREAAEDILQDVYVKVWRRASAFDASRASPITWLAVIARNTAIDWRRSDRRHDAGPEEWLAAVADDSPLADAHIELEDDRRRLATCLDKLDGNQAQAIRRTILEGLTYRQLADTIATPPGTVKSWIRRGLLKLKECLGDG